MRKYGQKLILDTVCGFCFLSSRLFEIQQSVAFRFGRFTPPDFGFEGECALLQHGDLAETCAFVANVRKTLGRPDGAMLRANVVESGGRGIISEGAHVVRAKQIERKLLSKTVP